MLFLNHRRRSMLVSPALLLLAAPAAAQAPAASRLAHAEQPAAESVLSALPTDDFFGAIWDERAAEHLLNRAGFGARPAEIRRVVRMGQEGCVEWLLTAESDATPFYVQRHGPDYRGMRDLSDEERSDIKRQVRKDERQQMVDFTTWWYERLLSGDQRLRERMTLFWHGFLTSSPAGVRRTFELLNQNAFLRENALGSYADLLRGITRDPAMLMYLDNHVNRKESPNENFARELMELFSLGEGNYTERDVKEAARALTGRASDGDGEYVFRARSHDYGEKTILGVTGEIDGDELIEIILQQDACPRWVAGRLIEYFEGLAPSEERLAEYAAFLRKNEFEITPFLRKLFTDPQFYRDEVVGSRVASPVDYLVGIARRLDLEPPGELLHSSAAALGQKLLHPPNVKGWEEGMAWVSTATFMQRGNFAGMMLGVVAAEDVLSQDDWEASSMEGEAMMDGAMRGEAMMDAGDPNMSIERERQNVPAELKLWRRARGGWRSKLNLGALVLREGARGDDEVVDLLLSELLAIEVSAETREFVLDYFRQERRRLGLTESRVFRRRADAETLLRRTAHLILSLPEGQLV